MTPRRLVLLSVALFASAATGSADTVASYLDNAFTATSSTLSIAASSVDSNTTASSITRSLTATTGTVGFSQGTGTFFTRSDLVPSSGATVYLSFNVSPQAGYDLDLTSLTFKFGGSNSGGSSVTYFANTELYYSLNNFTTAGILIGSTSNTTANQLTLASGSVINTGYTANFDLSSIAALSSSENIAFRIAYTDNSASSNITFRLDDVALNGTVASAIPEPSAYAIIAGVLTLGLVVVRRRRA